MLTVRLYTAPSIIADIRAAITFYYFQNLLRDMSDGTYDATAFSRVSEALERDLLNSTGASDAWRSGKALPFTYPPPPGQARVGL